MPFQQNDVRTIYHDHYQMERIQTKETHLAIELTREKLGVLLVDDRSKVTAVIKDHIELLAILEGAKLLLNAPNVLLLSFTLPGKNRDT